ncbi:MAG: aspartate--tRNA(Asn) ligase [Nanoarchaeota archaeon]|nr:aspartate--tRNA(Asn) ligase [Nanoarchaeota archaeon]
MERTYVKEIRPDKDVLIKGWVYESRVLAKMAFLLIRDSSGIIQGIVKEPKLLKIIQGITLESVVEVRGKVKKAEIRAEFARNDVEIDITSIEVLSLAEKLPIHVNEKAVKSELPSRLDWRCLSLRTPKSQATFKVQSKIIEGMQEYLNANGFRQVFTPCLMGVASESGSEVFEVGYFKKKAYLRQDPQLHRQLTIAGGIEKVYDIGPSWRAEKSNTVRHLCEHRTCAVELSFIKDERDVMRVEEQVVISALKKVNEECKDELSLFGAKLTIPKAPFPEIEFPEVYKIMKKMGRDIKVGEDLDLDAERLLWKYVQEKYPGAEFYFLNKFPFKKKPFYVYCDEKEDYARSTDLYYRGIEMSSGGQRENRYDKLMKNVKDKKIPLHSADWFTKFFKYGVPTHGGFALGIERITMVLLGLENVREAVLFPRDPERLTP